MQIKLTIKGQKLTIAQETIAEQTIDYLEAEASFSSEWDNLVKFAHFTKANCSGEEENYVIELVNDKITKDKHLNLSKGEWIVSLHGNEIVGDEVVERATTTIAQLYVKATGNLNGEPLPITPPSVGEQILAKVLEANTRSEEAKNISEDANAKSTEALEKTNIAIQRADEAVEQAENALEESEKALVEVRAYDTKINEALENSQEALEISGTTSQNLQLEINRATSAEQNLELNKANKSETYTKQEVDEKIAQATPSDYEEVKEQVELNKGNIESIQVVIPNQASEDNQLADKDFVNSSIATNTSTFIGTFNSVAELEAYSGAKTNNDYAFVVINDETTGLVKEYDRYKWTGTQWLFEYSLNNSSFNAQQWATINSGLTSNDVTDLRNALIDIVSLQNNKVDKVAGKGLSSNDFTNEEKNKLESLENYDDTLVKQDIRNLQENKANTTYVDQEDEKLKERIRAIEESRIPNVILSDDKPTINGSQMSGFSLTKYAKFPFLLRLSKPFDIKFEFTTSNDVTNQQNIMDSDFGLAFAIRNSRFVIALSTNGTSWNLGEGVGTFVVQPNTSYLVKISWDGNTYTMSYSLDAGQTYIVDITKVSSDPLYPKQIFIGVGQNGGTILNYFKGVIDFQYASVTLDGEIIYLGYDDIGVLTRMDRDMDNITEDGIRKVKDIISEEGYLKEHQSLDNYYTKSQVDESQAKQDYEINKTNRSLSALWELNKGQTYRFETDSTSGDKVVPSGAKLGTLEMLGGISRKGRNLLSSYHVNQSSNPFDNALFENSYKFKPNTQYVISFIGANGNVVYPNENIFTSTPQIVNDGTRKYLTLTTVSDINESNISQYNAVYGWRILKNGASNTIIPNFAEVMIEEGTTPSPYEPYTDQLIDGKVDEVRNYGKNLFDISFYKNYLTLQNGYYKVASWLELIQNKFYPRVKPNTIYTFSWVGYDEASGSVRARVVLHYTDGTSSQGAYLTGTEAKQTLTSTLGKTISYITFDYSGNTSNVLFKDVQLEENAQTTPYVPYREPITKPIPQSVQELDGYGIGINQDIYNYFEKVDDKVYFHKRVNQLDCGTRTYNKASWYVSDTYDLFQFVLSDSKPNGKVLCLQTVNLNRIDDNKYINFLVEKDKYTAVTFKQAMQGVMLYYELAEEVVTDVTDLFPQDFFSLEVEAGGTIEFNYPNKELYKLDIPNREIYVVKLSEVQ